MSQIVFFILFICLFVSSLSSLSYLYWVCLFLFSLILLVFVHVFFYVINNSYSFELKIWDFAPFAIIQVLCVFVEFLRCHILLIFNI
jgi:hypothetical protein